MKHQKEVSRMIKLKYQAHVAGDGWQDPVENWQIAGTVGQHKAIEAVRIVSLENDEGTNLGVVGKAHVQDIGWGNDEVNGADIGSTGLGKPLEAIKLGLFGDDADKYDIWYRLHVENKGFLPPVRDFEPSGTEGGGLQAEAIQIIIVRKDQNIWYASDTTIPFETIVKEVAPQPAEEPPASKRKRVIDMAASHIGESGTQFQARFGIQGYDWCAAFVCCILIDCGLKGLSIMSTYVPDIVDWAKSKGYWRGKGSNYQPKSGDFVIYDFNSNGTGDHIGFVHSSTGFSNTHAVEGNTGSPRLVRMQHRTSGILGYVALPYGD